MESVSEALRSELPHAVLLAHVRHDLGRRAAAFGPLVEDLFEPLVLGMTDQLSAYTQCVPAADLQVGPAVLREGRERSYLLVPVTDRGAPLRLREAMRRWDMQATDSESTLVGDVNARRWCFVARGLPTVLLPLLRGVADALGAYYARRPHAQLRAGMIRFLEDATQSVIAIEFDDRGPLRPNEPLSRWAVQ